MYQTQSTGTAFCVYFYQRKTEQKKIPRYSNSKLDSCTLKTSECTTSRQGESGISLTLDAL